METSDKSNTSDSSVSRLRTVLEQYRKDVEIGSCSHDIATKYYRTWDHVFAIPGKVLPFIATSLMVPSLSGAVYSDILEYTGLACTVLAGVITIMRDIFRHQERSVMHASACLDCGEMRRDISHFLTRDHSYEDTDVFTVTVEQRISTLGRVSPSIPGWVSARVRKTLAAGAHAKLLESTLDTQVFMQSNGGNNKKTSKKLLGMTNRQLRRVLNEAVSKKRRKKDEIVKQRVYASESSSDACVASDRSAVDRVVASDATKHQLIEAIILDYNMTDDFLMSLTSGGWDTRTPVTRAVTLTQRQGRQPDVAVSVDVEEIEIAERKCLFRNHDVENVVVAEEVLPDQNRGVLTRVDEGVDRSIVFNV